MDRSTKKILVVEDDGLLQKILTDKLRLLNYQVFAASDGREALKIVEEQKPDLLLLDLLLPEIDGYRVLENIRKNTDKQIAETLVIVLSNLWSDRDILSAQALKIDAYFVKTTVDLDEVFSQVEKSLLAKEGLES